MNQTPINVCIHGTYVGGCGIDYMCHACEMGDLELSPNDAFEAAKRSWIRDMNAKVEDLMFVMKIHDEKIEAGYPRWGGEFSPFLAKVLRGEAKIFRRDTEAIFKRDCAYLAEATRWAEAPDDADWIYNRFAAWEHEWNRMSGDEQFASLPDYVLDGGY